MNFFILPIALAGAGVFLAIDGIAVVVDPFGMDASDDSGGRLSVAGKPMVSPDAVSPPTDGEGDGNHGYHHNEPGEAGEAVFGLFGQWHFWKYNIRCDNKGQVSVKSESWRCINTGIWYVADMSRIEVAVEKVKRLDENQADALLDWLELRENPGALRERLDSEIEVGLEQLKRGEKIPGDQVHAEIRERSRRRRAGQNG